PPPPPPPPPPPHQPYDFIRDLRMSRGLGFVYKRQTCNSATNRTPQLFTMAFPRQFKELISSMRDNA
ncbi:hypothetical protein OQ618_24815, partial [Escherichia coli]|uniref:hypothetical protein n=1 Tax=Escherichia coli TaxID=562 RepID=UPI00224EAEB9